jgi:hypothetical protein
MHTQREREKERERDTYTRAYIVAVTESPYFGFLCCAGLSHWWILGHNLPCGSHKIAAAAAAAAAGGGKSAVGRAAAEGGAAAAGGSAEGRELELANELPLSLSLCERLLGSTTAVAAIAREVANVG